jgi:hypothetical protein
MSNPYIRTTSSILKEIDFLTTRSTNFSEFNFRSNSELEKTPITVRNRPPTKFVFNLEPSESNLSLNPSTPSPFQLRSPTTNTSSRVFKENVRFVDEDEPTFTQSNWTESEVGSIFDFISEVPLSRTENLGKSLILPSPTNKISNRANKASLKPVINQEKSFDSNLKRSGSVLLNAQQLEQLNTIKNVEMRKATPKPARPRSLVIEKGEADFRNKLAGANLKFGSHLNLSQISSAQPRPPLALSYKLNVDESPILIRKKPTQKLEYTQNVSLKYLKPPKPEKPGDIVLIQEPTVQIRPAPALLIREKAEKPVQPAPVVFREKPPKQPEILPPKEIKIPGRVLEPPPRQVITEQLPKLPDMPADIIIERWLGYERRNRNVVFKPAKPISLLPKPRNVLIEWEQPEVDVKKEFSYLGVETVDPVEYEARYDDLVKSSELPDDVNSFKTPDGEVLGVNSGLNDAPLLTGDVNALKFVDLKSEGLAEYECQL